MLSLTETTTYIDGVVVVVVEEVELLVLVEVVDDDVLVVDVDELVLVVLVLDDVVLLEDVEVVDIVVELTSVFDNITTTESVSLLVLELPLIIGGAATGYMVTVNHGGAEKARKHQ